MNKFIKKNGLLLSWLIACIASLGSILLSEGRDMEPCLLCWYQRIAIFPLVIILAIAFWKKVIAIIPYILPLTLIGLIFSLLQLLIQEIPHLETLICKNTVCIQKPLLGQLTFPLLSLATFILLNGLLIWTYHVNKRKFWDLR
ncbi:MAG: disulfide bond formation protein B [Chlamydiae bacterium]|nr:disulfide bond formation protein B [Chlamydiota bacterium]